MNKSLVQEKIRVSPLEAAEKDIVINLLIVEKAINKV